MRTLSLTDCVQFNFSGTVLKNGLCFGDVDNDGLNEFVVGNTDGALSIFRNNKCIVKAIDLGEISGVIIGDLLNIERNVLVVVSIDGWCHVFDVEKELELIQVQQSTSLSNEKTGSRPSSMISTLPATATSTTPGLTPSLTSHISSDTEGLPHFLGSDYSVITPFHSQRILPNVKTIHLGDVNSDGLIEMIVGLTDRVLRTYQWKVETEEQNISLCTSAGLVRAYYENPIYEGRLVALNKWEFPSQICSTSLYQKDEATLSILISHPGTNVTEISEVLKEKVTPEQQMELNLAATGSTATESSFERSVSGKPSTTLSSTASTSAASGVLPNRQRNFSVRGESKDPDTTRTNGSCTRIVIEQHDLFSAEDDDLGRRNKNITSEVLGNVKSMKEVDENSECYAVVSLDGTIVIAKNNHILWKLEVEQQIFALAQIHGKLITCSWSGETYLIDSKECIRFYFEEPVLTFCAGMFGLWEDFYCKDSKLVNQFCIAYVTFNDKIYIYPVEPSII